MPLTNAEKQRQHRARRKAKLERLAVLEGALAAIAATDNGYAGAIARKALGDVG